MGDFVLKGDQEVIKLAYDAGIGGKNSRGGAVEYSIALRRHWWFDAGIAGLYSISKSRDDRLLEFDVEVKVDSDNQALTFEGKDTDTLRAYFETCYEMECLHNKAERES